MQEISFQRALDTAREVVAERPENINRTRSFKGGCLVGVMLERMGIPIRYRDGSYYYRSHSQMLHMNLIKYDTRTGIFLDRLLLMNDMGLAWQRCLFLAEEAVRWFDSYTGKPNETVEEIAAEVEKTIVQTIPPEESKIIFDKIVTEFVTKKEEKAVQPEPTHDLALVS